MVEPSIASLDAIAVAIFAQTQAATQSDSPATWLSALSATASAIAAFLAWLAARASAATQAAEAAARHRSWKQRADGLAISLRYELELAALYAFRALKILLVDASADGVRRSIAEVAQIKTPVLESIVMDTSIVEKDIGKAVLLAQTDLKRVRDLFARYQGNFDLRGVELLKEHMGGLSISLETSYKQACAFSGQGTPQDLKAIVDASSSH